MRAELVVLLLLVVICLPLGLACNLPAPDGDQRSAGRRILAAGLVACLGASVAGALLLPAGWWLCCLGLWLLRCGSSPNGNDGWRRGGDNHPPPRPPQPTGGIDWQAFDRQRASWAESVPPRPCTAPQEA